MSAIVTNSPQFSLCYNFTQTILMLRRTFILWRSKFSKSNIYCNIILTITYLFTQICRNFQHLLLARNPRRALASSISFIAPFFQPTTTSNFHHPEVRYCIVHLLLSLLSFSFLKDSSI